MTTHLRKAGTSSSPSMASQGHGQRTYVQPESNDMIVSRLAREDNVPWHRKHNLRLLYFLMVPTCLGVEMTTGFDASMVNGLQAVPSWVEYYNHPRSALLGLMVAMYSLGSFACAPLVPIVIDKIGGRYTILLGGTISIIGGILQGSALNFAMFTVARFMLGVSDVFCTVAASSLTAELPHPKERAVMGALFNNFYYVGAVFAGAVTLETFAMTSNWAWRIPSFLQVVPSLLQISFIWFLPESPRWLISKGRGNEAYSILAKYHAEGDEHSEFVRAEYTQIEETLELELKIARTNQSQVFSTPGMRKRIIVTSCLGLFTQWCGIGLVAYFLSPVLDGIGIHDNRTKQLINLAISSWGLVTGTFSALIVPRYSRRAVFLGGTLSTFLVFTAWTTASAAYSSTRNQVSARAALIFIFLYGPAYNIAFTPLPYTYVVELFPFHVRASGISLYQWCSRGATFLGQFVDPIGIDIAGWRWYIVYCVWNAFQVVFIYFVFPETSGRTLEELTFLYEDEQEVFGRGGFEPLREHGQVRTYNSTEDT